jgi:threonine synthase
MPAFDPVAIDRSTWTLARYAGLLPAAPTVSLGEGGTPLVEVTAEEGTVLAKLEHLSPTGSFKDRGSAVLISHLRGHGVERVLADSSGNAGASVAAYAAAAGMRARVYVPAHASTAKKRQIAAFGATVVEVPGLRSAASDACLADVAGAPAGTAYGSHAWHPSFLAGQLTCAWEIWEQLGGEVPDAVVCPVGQGNLFLGLARGFQALYDAGLTTRLPRMYAVQSSACAPVSLAYAAGSVEPATVVETDTVAEGIRSAVPVRGREILRALARTGGAAFAVADEAVLAAQRHLARVGVLVEPTSAVVMAALPRVRAQLGPGGVVVAPLTGSGLKGADRSA